MKSICHYSLFFYRLIPFSFFCGMLPSPIFCVPSQFVSWSAHPLKPPSETYVSALHDMWSTKERKLSMALSVNWTWFVAKSFVQLVTGKAVAWAMIGDMLDNPCFSQPVLQWCRCHGVFEIREYLASFIWWIASISSKSVLHRNHS